MTPEIIFLVGPPLSGKDTYIREKVLGNDTIISRDDIVMELSPGKSYTEAFQTVDQKLVDELLNKRLQDAIDSEDDIIINLTNLTRRSRKRFLDKVRDTDYKKIAIVFPRLEFEEYLERNRKREREDGKFIPPNVIDSMLKSWEPVSKLEGFDHIFNLKR